ncbi:MAG: hypothetical protein H7101_07230 [Deinococcales bacterium]|nr:hypothetical protein [Chitinophagaceae bacterium]
MKKWLLITLVVLISSCKLDENSKSSTTIKDTTRFIVDIPVKLGGKKMYNRLASDRALWGKWDSLENGYSNLQIRVWYEYDNYKKNTLVLKKDKEWVAEWHTRISKIDNEGNIISRNRTIETSTPKMGWNMFMDSLFKLKILTLPSQSELPDKYMYYNTNTILVEIADRHHYRFYYYTGHEHNINLLKEAKAMDEILNLIESELGFKRTGRFI